MIEDKKMFYVYISIMIIATTISQLSLKHGVSLIGEIPSNIRDGFSFIVKAFTTPFVLLSFFLTVIGALSWLAAISKAELSFAYPFSTLTYVLILLISSFILKEHVSILRWIGVSVIIIGVFIVSKS